jgi:hypothetical protein
MGRALSFETYTVAFADYAAARRQRRSLLRSLSAAVACERLPLLAWRDQARAARDECRRKAAETAAVAVASPKQAIVQVPAVHRLPLLTLTTGTFRAMPIKGILAEVDITISPIYSPLS